LRQFIRHVVLRCVALRSPQLALPETSILIGRVKSEIDMVSFVSVDDPEAVLRELLQLYTTALNGPLPLFPESSRHYAASVFAGKSREQALSRARHAYEDEQLGSDGQDAYVQQLFADFDAALTEQPGAFEAAAERAYLPLFQARRAP